MAVARWLARSPALSVKMTLARPPASSSSVHMPRISARSAESPKSRSLLTPATELAALASEHIGVDNPRRVLKAVEPVHQVPRFVPVPRQLSKRSGFRSMSTGRAVRILPDSLSAMNASLAVETSWPFRTGHEVGGDVLAVNGPVVKQAGVEQGRSEVFGCLASVGPGPFDYDVVVAFLSRDLAGRMRSSGASRTRQPGCWRPRW